VSRVCPPAFAFLLHNPLRAALTDRKAVLEESGIGRDSVVLEAGPGNGFFTEVLAERAAKVYAVELQPGMAEKLIKRLPPSAGNVEVIVSDIAGLDLPPGSIDVAFLHYAFHEFSDQEAAAENISRLVRDGGFVSIHEPTVEVNSRRMEETVRMFERRGFEKDRERKTLFKRFARLRKRG